MSVVTTSSLCVGTNGWLELVAKPIKNIPLTLLACAELGITPRLFR
jgi:hypothetical protein